MTVSTIELVMKSKFDSKIAYYQKMMCITAKKQKTKGLTIKICIDWLRI